MDTRLLVRLGIALAVGVSSLPNAAAQSNQEWIAIKSKCGLSSSLAYNDWAASGAPCPGNTAAKTAPATPATLNPAMSNAVQSLGNSIGQEIGKAIFGDPAANAANAAAAQQRNLAAQRSALAAEQLYKSGLYLLNLKPKTPASTAAAIVEFQKALDITPNDANILSKLASAKQQLKDIAVAGQTSDALSRVLPPAPPVNKGIVGDELTHGSIPSPNASALSLVNLDPSAVDLRSATSASPESLKNQLTGVFANNNAAAPPDPLLVLPQPGDFELLFDPPQASPSQWKGPQRPANSPKLVNPMDAEEQTKAQVEAVAAQPGGLNDLMEDQLIKDALAGLVPTKPVPAVPAAKPAPARPHN